MKYVNGTSAGRAIEAFVILKGTKQIAKVQVHYAPSGGVLVNAFQGHESALKCAMRFHKTRVKELKGKTDWDTVQTKFGAQEGRAGGAGYDKFTACLSGMWIDGHMLTDHCARNGAPKPPKGRATWPRGAEPKRGYFFANWCELLTDGEKPEHLDAHKARKWPDGTYTDKTYHDRVKAAREAGHVESGYSDCYRKEGMKYLRAFGYTVIQAI